MPWIAWLRHPRFLPLLLVATFLACLPMLGLGYFLDDYQQRTVLLTGANTNLFSFFTRQEAHNEAFFQQGVLPWWFWPDTKINFLRPLAGWLIRLDHALWPDQTRWMHLHSVLWYVALVAVAGVAYRRLLPSAAVAGLAVLIFAFDYRHAAGVAWLCNRNAVLALLLSLLVLLAHRSDRVGWRVLAVPLFALSLAAGEAALAMSGYLLAHERYLSGRRPLHQVLALLPYALVALVWIAFWQLNGYGVAGPGFYIDVMHQPGLFLEALVYRAPAFLMGQFTAIPVEVFAALEATFLLPGWRLASTLALLAVVGALAWAWRPLWRESPTARFFALGMAIALIPICASNLVSRSLWYVSFGAIGLIALQLAQYHAARSAGASRATSAAAPGRALAVLLVATHLVLSPLLFLATPAMARALAEAVDAEKTRLVTADPARRVLLLTTAIHEMNVMHPLVKADSLGIDAQGRPSPPRFERLLTLVQWQGTYQLARPQPDTLVLSAESGMPGLGRTPYGFRAGQGVTLPDVRIRVDRVTADGAPQHVTFRFAPGVLPTYRVLRWEGDGFVPATLPVVGDVMTLTLR